MYHLSWKFKLFKLALHLAKWGIAAFVAWELKERKAIRDKKIESELSDGVMTATIIHYDGTCELQYDAEVNHNDGIYQLKITSPGKTEGASHSVTAHNSKAELEKHLIDNTLFRMSDFITR